MHSRSGEFSESARASSWGIVCASPGGIAIVSSAGNSVRSSYLSRNSSTCSKSMSVGIVCTQQTDWINDSLRMANLAEARHHLVSAKVRDQYSVEQCSEVFDRKTSLNSYNLQL